MQTNHARHLLPAKSFSQTERDAVYKAIYTRRDVRNEFLPSPVEDEVLLRLLEAAHAAPSVGLMQPWNFTIIRDAERRKAVHGLFEQANLEASRQVHGDQKRLYNSLQFADKPLAFWQ